MSESFSHGVWVLVFLEVSTVFHRKTPSHTKTMFSLPSRSSRLFFKSAKIASLIWRPTHIPLPPPHPMTRLIRIGNLNSVKLPLGLSLNMWIQDRSYLRIWTWLIWKAVLKVDVLLDGLWEGMEMPDERRQVRRFQKQTSVSSVFQQKDLENLPAILGL